MKKLLVIKCSPKHSTSNSFQLAQHFTDFLFASSETWQVETLDLWEETLPIIDENVVSAKFAKFQEEPLDATQVAVWRQIEQQFERFKQAQAVLIALPIWNFGVPYVLKHYIDTITQPSLCFSWSPQAGYASLLDPKPAFVVASSASDYRPQGENNADDFCLSYLHRWLTVYMGCNVSTVIYSPTVDAPDVVTSAKQEAYQRAEQMAKKLIDFSA